MTSSLRTLRRTLLAGLPPRTTARAPFDRPGVVVVGIPATPQTLPGTLAEEIAELAPGADVVRVGPERYTLHGGLVHSFEVFPGAIAAPLHGGDRPLIFGGAA